MMKNKMAITILWERKDQGFRSTVQRADGSGVRFCISAVPHIGAMQGRNRVMKGSYRDIHICTYETIGIWLTYSIYIYIYC